MAGLRFQKLINLKESVMKKLFLLAVSLLFAVQSQAALVSGPDIIAAVSIQEDSPVNTAQQAFDEKQSVLLTRDITVDGGIISKGTVVDSHIIFLNTRGGTFATDTQRWTFASNVLGVMSNYTGSLMNDSNDLFAAFNDYFSAGSSLPFAAAGLEGNDSYNFFGNTIEVTMSVTEPGDWIRVLTAQVPVPAAVWLFLPALLGFMGLRRKAKSN